MTRPTERSRRERDATLELHYYRGRRPNFGDDLNPLLWREVLPPAVWDAPDTVLIGIGSILTGAGIQDLVDSGARVVVVGTGTSYGGAPQPADNLHVVAVRGPLTASVMRRPEVAATDGAYLVVDAPRVLGARRPRTETLFIPHHRTLRDRPWADVAFEAGMSFVSPQWSVDQVFERFAEAQLVVTEAMHGAIIADALRIPWIPVAISPDLDEFKWRDWLGSVELPFDPAPVPAADPRDKQRNARMRRELERRGLARLDNLGDRRSPDELSDWLEERYAPEAVAAIGNTEFATLPQRARSAVALLGRTRALADTVSALRSAAARRPLLSSDAIHEQRLEQLRSAVAEASDLILAG